MSLAVPVWTIHTEVFDGPLDLLLHLVKRDGIDLRYVQISRIADAYLSYLDRMYEVHLGIAAEYLVMAATLCYLKSLELLPRLPTATKEDEDVEDPRQKLVKQLIEHERYRGAADHLDQCPMVGRDTFVREPVDLPGLERPLIAGIDAFALLDLYHHLLRRPDKVEQTYDLVGRGPDIGTCVRRVLDGLGEPGGKAELGALLRPLSLQVERVLTFLAVLEMNRLQWLDIDQLEHLGPVWLTRRVGKDVDLSVVVGKIDVETAVPEI